MSMDTPERNQIGTPISKIEESPFSNFINSLSPINPTKTVHISQTFSSISFASPPSVFTSPHVSLQKDLRFLRRHQVSDLAKTQVSTDEGNKDSEAEQVLVADQLPENPTNEQKGEGASSSEACVDPLCDVSTHTTAELPRVLKYDSGSPDCKSGRNEIECEQDVPLPIVPFVQEPCNRGSFGAKLHLHEIEHDNEEAACDWQNLISGATDLFVFDSPNDAATLKGSFQKSLDEEPSAFASILSRFPPDYATDVRNSSHVAPLGYHETHENIDQSTQPIETNEVEQINQPSENLPVSCINQHFSGDSDEKSGSETLYHLPRGLRRRCLVFEMPRAKNIDGVMFSSSSSSIQNEEKALSGNKQPITSGSDSSRRILPGIGLHLNALAAASKDCRVPNQDMLSPTSQGPLTNLSAAASFEKDVGPTDNGAQVVEDSSQASTYAASEELNPNSPKKKRRKFDNVGESEGCKRCNCKKSKCLKLYCECFAAGVYCVEPCSCQDCFNKPIHEDTVLATRKQIESRNPLAFAPKVIRTSDFSQEHGEDSTRTPASARHKRGCNCKKSNCLKKYCECYQGGVGCSVSCRCEGCKNAFGRKDGPTLLAEAEIDEARASEKHIMDKSSDLPAFCNEEDQNSEFTLPKTPLRLFRPSLPLPSSSKGKPPRSSLAAINSSSCLHSADGTGRSTFLRSQTGIEKFQGASVSEIPTVLQTSSPPSNVKTLSPNSKRVSPPHHEKGQSPGLRSSRKLILQSIPSFPKLTPRR